MNYLSIVLSLAFGIIGILLGGYSALFACTSGTDLVPVSLGPHVRRIEFPDEDAIIERFAGFLRFPTLANEAMPNAIGPEESPTFHAALAYLRTHYAAAFESPLEVEMVEEFTLLLKWPGTDPALAPALFISHYDIVPAPPANWTHGPFSGARAEGYVWGRGALDVKISTTAALEAICAFRRARPGWRPQRTLYFTSGHDEELGGLFGATGVARLLKERGVRLAVIVDEGGAVMKQGIAGLLPDRPVAMIGTAEKGFVRVEATITGERAGHASMPSLKANVATSILGKLIARLDARPPPPRLSQPMVEFFLRLAHYTPAYLRPVLHAARFPFGSRALAYLMGRASDESAALVRFTIAVTDIHAGVAYNVIPRTAQVGFNCRVPPGFTAQSCVDHLTALLDRKDRALVQFSIDQRSLGVPSPISSARGWAFAQVERAIVETISPQEVGSPLPGTIAVTPYLMLAGTDSKRFYDVVAWAEGGSIMRFTPLLLGPGDMARIHSVDERISEGNVVTAVKFYYRAIELLGGGGEGGPGAKEEFEVELQD